MNETTIVSNNAQTILQLFNQMRRNGCSSTELLTMRRAYELAMRLFAGGYTGSAKTSLAHHVGTGSAALRHAAPFEVALAGVLHGAYLAGAWGHYLRRPTAAKRDVVRAVVGERAEACIHGFMQMAWNPHAIATLVERLDSLNATERDTVLLKLLDDLDYLTDLGGLYMYRKPDAVRAELTASRAHRLRLAERLSGPGLATELDRLITLTLAAEVPAELCGLAFPVGPPIVLASPAYRKRRLLQAFHFVSRKVRRLLTYVRRRPGDTVLHHVRERVEPLSSEENKKQETGNRKPEMEIE